MKNIYNFSITNAINHKYQYTKSNRLYMPVLQLNINAVNRAALLQHFDVFKIIYHLKWKIIKIIYLLLN